MRIIVASSLAVLALSCGAALAQTAPSAPSSPATPSPPAASGAPPSGAPGLAPVPATPGPAPQTTVPGNTPSQTNLDVFPPSRLTNPPAGTASRPAAPTPQQNAQPSGGTRQPGGANSSPPSKPKVTGADYTLTECLRLWDAGTHMSKREWAVACKRVERRLDNLDSVATENDLKKSRTSRRERKENIE